MWSHQPEGSYLDKTFEWEKKYEYRILTLTQVHSQGLNASVPGEGSSPVEIFTRDIYPPAQPVGLQAVFSSVGQKPFVDLTWAPNLESDLAGYNVFRRVEGGPFEKLNQQLIQVSSFRDQNVEPGKKYVYVVSAVDLRGNESPRSAEASEEVPGKQWNSFEVPSCDIADFNWMASSSYGLIENQGGADFITRTLTDAPHSMDDFGGAKALDIPLGEVRLLAPVQPSKIVCIGRNYREHAKELNHPIPTEPLFFLKPPSSVIGPGDEIRRPNHAFASGWITKASWAS